MIAYGGLGLALRLAERCGLDQLADAQVRITAPDGANPAVKITSIVAGMMCGADNISDLDLLRHGGMDKVFDKIRAPSTLGSFLRVHLGKRAPAGEGGTAPAGPAGRSHPAARSTTCGRSVHGKSSRIHALVPR